jgi:uncharacterized protein (DUF433 family)
LETVIHSFQRGETAEEIALQFPSLPLADVYATIAYYLKHRAQVDAYLRTAEEKESEILRQVRARSTLADLRKRLQNRRKPVEP